MKSIAAYTLIEILVGILVIGIVFSGLGFASYNDFSKRQRVVSANRILLSDLRLAQKEAISGRKPAGCSGVLDGYLFTLSSCSGSGCSTYNISVSCGGSVGVPIKSVNLPANVYMSNSTSGVLFKSLGAGTNIQVGQSIVITMTDTASSVSNTVTISETGEIK